MKSIYFVSILIIFALSLSAVPCFAADVFYLVLQWPGSYCSAKQGCCYPKTGKPARDFPEFCDSRSHCNIAKVTGIKPNGTLYEAGDAVNESIRKAVGYMPGLWCSEDKSGQSQLYQVVLCSDVRGTEIMDCPGIPIGKCARNIKFPPF